MADQPPRQTLAILFCDIVGMSRLMAREGDLLISRVLRDFFEAAGRLSQDYRRLMIKFIGDGFLAAFEDVAQALPFAVAIDNLRKTEPSLRVPDLAFKFSVDVGETLLIETSYGTDAFGEAVNVAARLNDLAAPDQIVVSQAALDRMPAPQRALAGSGEWVRIKGGEVEIHRVTLAAVPASGR